MCRELRTQETFCLLEEFSFVPKTQFLPLMRASGEVKERWPYSWPGTWKVTEHLPIRRKWNHVCERFLKITHTHSLSLFSCCPCHHNSIPGPHHLLLSLFIQYPAMMATFHPSEFPKGHPAKSHFFWWDKEILRISSWGCFIWVEN